MASTEFLADSTMQVLVLLAIALAGVQYLRALRLGQTASKTIHLLRRRRENYHNMSRALSLAEDVGCFGVWQFMPDRNQQQWSRGLRALFGLDPGEAMQAGDAETLLESNQMDLEMYAREVGYRDEAISARFKIRGIDDKQRFLDMRMCTMRRSGRSGARGVMAVFLDVTAQIEREEQLQHSEREALAEARLAREEANRDALTGLANRRFVMHDLDRRLARRNRQDDAISLILFDIDHFKSVNDTYGHLAGDAVLRRIGRIFSEQAREGDVVGRIGGEEFVWVLAGADRALTEVIGERLRRAVALGSAVAQVPPVTISIGCVTATETDSSLSLFARADEALYIAKNEGRNTVRMAA